MMMSEPTFELAKLMVLLIVTYQMKFPISNLELQLGQKTFFHTLYS